MRSWLILLASTFALTGIAEAAEQPVYAIVGARLMTVSGATLDSGTIVLRNGLIDAVGPDVAAPPDARTIDGKGWTLTPGLIDAFGGVGLPQEGPGREGGSRRSRASGAASKGLDPQGSALDALDARDALTARDKGLTTALVISPEGVLPEQSVLIDLSGETKDAMVLEQPAALHLHMATLARTYPDSLMGTVALARQALYDARHYREEWAAYRKSPRGKKRPRYDAGLEAWARAVDGEIPLVVTAFRENDIRRALGLRDEFKIRVVVADAPQAWRVAGLIKERKLPLVVGVNFDPPRPAIFFRPPDDEKEKKDIEEAEANPAKLNQAGVSFALGSSYAKDFVGGIRKAIERGLPREAALRAATLSAAEVLGVADRTGSLEAGKLANLVAWTGEPFAKDSKVKMVFVDGELYEPPDRPGKDAGGEKKTPSRLEVSR